MAEPREPQNVLIIVYGLLASFLLVVLVLGLLYYFGRVKQAEFHAKIDLVPNTKLRELRADEDEQLHQYALINKEKNLVRIPIERAMELEAQGSWRQDVPLPVEAPKVQARDGGTTHGTPQK